MSREEDRIASGQGLGPPVCGFASAKLGQRRRRAASRRHTPQGTGLRRLKHNRTILGPGAAAVTRRVGERDCCAAGHGNLLQLAICKKSNPLPVGREERVPRIHGAGERSGT
jgi:hypothetical protein